MASIIPLAGIGSGDGFARGELAPSHRRTLRQDGLDHGSKEALRLRLAIGLVLCDTGALLIAFMLANLLRFDRPSDWEGLKSFLILVPILLVMTAGQGGYSVAVLKDPRRGAAIAVKSAAIAAAIIIGLLFFLKVGDDFSRLIFGLGAGLAFVVLAVTRLCFGHAAGRAADWSFTNEILLLDGVDATPARHAIVVHADRDHFAAGESEPVMLDRMGRLLKNYDRVVLACAPERRAAWIGMLKGLNVDVEVLMPEIDFLGPLQLRRFGGHSTAMIGCKPLNLRNRILKRGLDLAIAVPAVFLLAPVLGVIALAIKLDSPGPVLFRQPRVGRGNRIFQIFKFRSMRAASTDHAGATSTRRDDDRITRIGALIRRTSLDELPQLFNVLLGEMSIAGPRPHAIGSTAEDRLFWEIESRYFERHSMKPGMTGLAQVRGFRGATERCSDLSSRLQADLEYLSAWTVWRDIWIIARTAGVFLQRNAF